MDIKIGHGHAILLPHVASSKNQLWYKELTGFRLWAGEHWLFPEASRVVPPKSQASIGHDMP
jgi:hypothetical protein